MWPEMKSKICIVTSDFPPNGNKDSKTILSVLKVEIISKCMNKANVSGTSFLPQNMRVLENHGTSTADDYKRESFLPINFPLWRSSFGIYWGEKEYQSSFPFLTQAVKVSTIGNIIADMNSSYFLTPKISKKTGLATDTEEEETKFLASTTIPSFFVIILQQSFQLEQNSPVITLLPVQVNCSYWEFVLSALSLGITLGFYDEEHRNADGHNFWHFIDRYKVGYALIMENHMEFLGRTEIQPNPKSSFQFLSRITLTGNSLSELQKKYLLKYLKKESQAIDETNSLLSSLNHNKPPKFVNQKKLNSKYLSPKDYEHRNTNCSSNHRKHLRSKESIEGIVKNGYHLFSEADTASRLQTSPRKSPTFSPPCFCTMFIYVFIVWMWKIYSE